VPKLHFWSFLAKLPDMAIQVKPKHIDDIIKQIEKLQQLAKAGIVEANKKAEPFSLSAKEKIDAHKEEVRRLQGTYDAQRLQKLKAKSARREGQYEETLKIYFEKNIKSHWDKFDIFLYSLKPALDLLDYQIVNQIQGLLNVEKRHVASGKQFADVTHKLQKIKARLELERQQQPVAEKPTETGQEIEPDGLDEIDKKIIELYQEAEKQAANKAEGKIKLPGGRKIAKVLFKAGITTKEYSHTTIDNRRKKLRNMGLIGHPEDNKDKAKRCTPEHIGDMSGNGQIKQKF
jgi:hypothetical protein